MTNADVHARACERSALRGFDEPEPASITTHVEYDGRGYLVTVTDRAPRKGEGIWYVPKDEALEDVLVRVVGGLETVARFAGPRDACGLSMEFRAYQDMDASYADGRDLRLVTVDVEPEPDEAAAESVVLADGGCAIPGCLHHNHPACPCDHPPDDDGPCGACNCCDDAPDAPDAPDALASTGMTLEIAAVPLGVRVRFIGHGREVDAGVFDGVTVEGKSLIVIRGGADFELAWHNSVRQGWMYAGQSWGAFALEPCAALAEGGGS